MSFTQRFHGTLQATSAIDRHRRAGVAAILILLGLIAATPSPCHAATITVCASGCDFTTIQVAINAANPGDTISVLDADHVESGITVNKNVAIQGQGATKTAVDGGGAGPVFTVNSTATTIRDMTIKNGLSDSINGGGIHNDGTLTVIDATLSNNQAVGFSGGGIFNGDGAILTISGSTLSENSAGGNGGGIENRGTLTITNSTLSQNSAGGIGGGIHSNASATIISSTLSGNSAASGGGLNNRPNNPQAPATVKNSIIANSTSGGDCVGAITAEGANLDTDGSCAGFTQVTSAQLNLGALALNAPGTTETFALLFPSVAIDKVPVADCTDANGIPLTTDQRGATRPDAGEAFCDIGAYESQGGPFQIQPLGHRVAFETYYDVASSAQVSAGGYGGPGHSGGSGDALIRLVDVGNFTVSTNNDPGALCANFYVFDDDQQEQACCSCLITANGATTTSVITNLISNPAFSNAKPSLGAVKVVGSFGTCANTPPTAASLIAANLAEGLKGWINHAEKIATNRPPSFAFVTSTSVERFAGAPLDSGELRELTSNCASIVRQASGAGICSCGVGL